MLGIFETVSTLRFRGQTIWTSPALLVGLGATSMGALHALKLGLPYSFGGANVALSEAFVRALGIWWLWAILAPAVFFIARRWHPERVGPGPAVVAHAAGAVLVSITHSLVYVPLIAALVWPELLPRLGSVWQINIVGNVAGDVFTYAAIAAGWYALDYRRSRSVAAGLPGVKTTTPPRPASSVPQMRQPPGRIAVRVGGALKLVPVDAIDRIEASGDYAELHCGDRRYLASERMTALAGSLDPAMFVRIHRSTIVRLAHIRELRPRTHGDYDVVLADGHVARLSRTYRDAVVAALRVHL